MFPYDYLYNSIDFLNSFIILPKIVMWEHDKLPSGINDDSQTSGINDEDTDLDDDDLDDNQDSSDDDSDDDQEEDSDDDQEEDSDDDQEEDSDDDQEETPEQKRLAKLERIYKTTNLQKKEIRNLKKELSNLKNSKSLSDEDLAKIKEKYNEEDLDIIEKIIEKKANELLDKRQSTSLAQRELNIFMKEHPYLSDPEIRHIRSLQKDYWYSLKKAYSILFGKSEDKKTTTKHSVWNSFWWDNSSKSDSKNKAIKDSDQAYKDMDQYL